MAENVLVVLTYKSVETILRTGGTQSWALNRARAMACRYVIVCRNALHKDVEGPERHAHGFIVAKIKDIIPSSEVEGRWLVLFSEYVNHDFGELWEGRNPIAYWKTDDFKYINFENLPFKSINLEKTEILEQQALTIAQAKEGLAKMFGVNPAAIKIQIEG